MINSLLRMFCFLLLVSFVLLSCKTKPVLKYQLTINDGYSNSYEYFSGDTVHIFSRNEATNELFSTWSGDTTNLNLQNEWHSFFIMPARNLTLSASFNPINYSLTYEKIKGKNSLKNVYYNFPQNHKGIVYLFHGAYGNAASWTNYIENISMIKELISNKFAVIITESEAVRWDAATLDSINNVDFANLKAITDTFYNRGATNRSIPRYTIGQSNGGSFSISFASFFKLKASVAYCASGGATGGVVNTTTTPILFCLQGKDNNSTMGASGNSSAISNSKALTFKGVCSHYHINDPSPLYEYRFSRNPLISNNLSQQIFSEIKNNSLLNEKKYFLGNANWTTSNAQPQNFPIISSLNTSQKNIIDEQISCITADHQFYSDYKKATIDFLNNQCQ